MKFIRVALPQAMVVNRTSWRILVNKKNLCPQPVKPVIRVSSGSIDAGAALSTEEEITPAYDEYEEWAQLMLLTSDSAMDELW